MGTPSMTITESNMVTTTDTDSLSVALSYKFGSKFKTTADVSMRYGGLGVPLK